MNHEHLQPIQANITGYGGQAVSLFSLFDEDTGILTLAVESDYRSERRDGCLLITNVKGIERDAWFGAEQLDESIASFQHLRGGLAKDARSSCLVVGERAQRANPGNAIEQDGFNERGIKYRISADLSNAQAAALATCHWAAHYGGMAQKALSASDDLLDMLLGGRGFSVGGDYFNGMQVEPTESLMGYPVDALTAKVLRGRLGL